MTLLARGIAKAGSAGSVGSAVKPGLSCPAPHRGFKSGHPLKQGHHNPANGGHSGALTARLDGTSTVDGPEEGDQTAFSVYSATQQRTMHVFPSVFSP